MPDNLLAPLLAVAPNRNGQAADLAALPPELVLWLSDCIDAALAARREAERAAFSRGRDLGWEEGARDLERREAERFRRMIERHRVLMRTPDYATLERLRWGAGGRPSWVIRRPGQAPDPATQLEPNAGRTPREMRRRARLAGEKDPFHIRWGPDMTCTACQYWGLPCPGDDPDMEAAEDAAGYG